MKSDNSTSEWCDSIKKPCGKQKTRDTEQRKKLASPRRISKLSETLPQMLKQILLRQNKQGRKLRRTPKLPRKRLQILRLPNKHARMPRQRPRQRSEVDYRPGRTPDDMADTLAITLAQPTRYLRSHPRVLHSALEVAPVFTTHPTVGNQEGTQDILPGIVHPTDMLQEVLLSVDIALHLRARIDKLPLPFGPWTLEDGSRPTAHGGTVQTIDAQAMAAATT